MKLLLKLKQFDAKEFMLKRKIKKQMFHVLKVGYKVNFSKLTKEKVNGMAWKERLLNLYILNMLDRDFSAFHRTVKLIANSLDAKLYEWDSILTKDGKLLSEEYNKVRR